MQIWATGDCHGNFRRFQKEYFPEQKDRTREDYVIILGDFGGIWSDSPHEREALDWLESLPFTTLWVDGNHENYDLLVEYPIREWQGGKVQFIRPHVIHLLRGQVFHLGGYSFFTMGGASSHDVQDGILDPEDPEFYYKLKHFRSTGAMFRVNHWSWWKEELPGKAEYAEARRNLKRAGYKADYILTHCAPSSIVDVLSGGTYSHDPLTDFLEEVKQKTDYRHWLFGHYHDNRAIDEKHILLYEQLVQVV